QVNFVIAGLTLALGVAAANPIWGPRIQMITFALSALTYLWVKRFCEGDSRALYLLPAVMLVWVNLHAGFVLGYAILGLALAFEAMIFLLIGGLALARRIEARQFLLLLVGLGLALHSVRNLSLFMLVAVPALADYAQQARERISLRWPRRMTKTTPLTFAVNV